MRDFERFIRVCAARSGQVLDKSAISRDVGVSAKAVGDWLSVLEASNQVQLLEPYLENIGQRMIKSPKLYFSDTGLLCFLLGLDATTLPHSPSVGALWEAFVLSELRKEQAQRGGSDTLWFYRDGAQREVDFLRAHGNALDLIEAKWSETPDPRDARVVEQIAALLAQKGRRPEVKRHLVCRTPHRSIVGQSTTVLSLQELLRDTTASSARP